LPRYYDAKFAAKFPERVDPSFHKSVQPKMLPALDQLAPRPTYTLSAVAQKRLETARDANIASRPTVVTKSTTTAASPAKTGGPSQAAAAGKSPAAVPRDDGGAQDDGGSGGGSGGAGGSGEKSPAPSAKSPAPSAKADKSEKGKAASGGKKKADSKSPADTHDDSGKKRVNKMPVVSPHAFKTQEQKFLANFEAGGPPAPRTPAEARAFAMTRRKPVISADSAADAGDGKENDRGKGKGKDKGKGKGKDNDRVKVRGRTTYAENEIKGYRLNYVVKNALAKNRLDLARENFKVARRHGNTTVESIKMFSSALIDARCYGEAMTVIEEAIALGNGAALGPLLHRLVGCKVREVSLAALTYAGALRVLPPRNQLELLLLTLVDDGDVSGAARILEVVFGYLDDEARLRETAADLLSWFGPAGTRKSLFNHMYAMYRGRAHNKVKPTAEIKYAFIQGAKK
jgi:hypothetical protein